MQIWLKELKETKEKIENDHKEKERIYAKEKDGKEKDRKNN